MESEFDKALRIACELLPQAQADALRLAVKAKTDNFTAVLERTWASQRDLAASRDAALAALAESEARRAESERTIKEMREGLHADCPHKPARLAAERSLAAAVEVLRRAQRTTRLKETYAARAESAERSLAAAVRERDSAESNMVQAQANAAAADDEARSARASLAAAVEVLRQADKKRHGSCWFCGRMPGEGHGDSCALGAVLGGGR